MEWEVDHTDGCTAQFDGKDNYHQIAEWQAKVGIRLKHGILVAMHGKNICDVLAVVVNSAIQWAFKNAEHIDPGTRALFLWLAINKQVRRSPSPIFLPSPVVCVALAPLALLSVWCGRYHP